MHSLSFSAGNSQAFPHAYISALSHMYISILCCAEQAPAGGAIPYPPQHWRVSLLALLILSYTGPMPSFMAACQCVPIVIFHQKGHAFPAGYFPLLGLFSTTTTTTTTTSPAYSSCEGLLLLQLVVPPCFLCTLTVTPPRSHGPSQRHCRCHCHCHCRCLSIGAAVAVCA